MNDGNLYFPIQYQGPSTPYYGENLCDNLTATRIHNPPMLRLDKSPSFEGVDFIFSVSARRPKQ